MGKIKCIVKKALKKLFGKAVTVKTIAEQNIYKNNSESYAGNSINNNNVLIVTNALNTTVPSMELEQLFANERANMKFISMQDGELNVQDIIKCSEKLCGPFCHIINIIDTKCGQFKGVYAVYHLLQNESNYLIDILESCGGTLCTVIITDDKIIGHTLKSLIGGLGVALGRHYIIENGLIATCNTPMDKIVKTAIYLSSKYGHILAGEVLLLHGTNQICEISQEIITLKNNDDLAEG